MALRPPPVILIGMHRSGTTLVTRLLRDAGVSFGVRRQPDEESRLFRRLNDWLFQQCGAAWDHPSLLHQLLEDTDLRTLIVRYLRDLLAGPQILPHLGLRRYLAHRVVRRACGPWGWKDPRNTFSLPLWLDVFPGARVIHVYRHGVDVASSLKIRRDAALAAATLRYDRHRRLGRHWLRPKLGGFTNSCRCATLAGAFSLWEEYLVKAREHVRTLGPRAIEVCYERLLACPGPELQRLTEFCSEHREGSRRPAPALQLRMERSFAFRARPELRAFAATVRDRLAAHGYSDEGRPEPGTP